jgi:hypothetical protein
MAMYKNLLLISVALSVVACTINPQPASANATTTYPVLDNTINPQDPDHRSDLYSLYDPDTAPVNVDVNAIRLIRCGNALGTAFYIGNDQYVTAYHVTRDKACYDVRTGVDFRNIESNQKLDFAIIANSRLAKAGELVPLKFDCQGFKKNKPYVSIGWAAGWRLAMNTQIATKKMTDNKFWVEGSIHEGLRELKGSVIQGMSGGPMVDAYTGLVTGINNITGGNYTISWSRELKDTSLCTKN